MSAFIFKRGDWLAHAASLVKRAKPQVSVASRFAECEQLLKGPISEEDREKAEQLTRVWLANHEAGC